MLLTIHLRAQHHVHSALGVIMSDINAMVALLEMPDSSDGSLLHDEMCLAAFSLVLLPSVLLPWAPRARVSRAKRPQARTHDHASIFPDFLQHVHVLRPPSRRRLWRGYLRQIASHQSSRGPSYRSHGLVSALGSRCRRRLKLGSCTCSAVAEASGAHLCCHQESRRIELDRCRLHSVCQRFHRN